MFTLPNLDQRTRALMLEEIEHDINQNRLYISPRLTSAGARDYARNLQDAARAGDVDSFTDDLRKPGQIETTELTKRGPKTMPHNAADTLAEGEFNRFYIRALCRRAIDDGQELIVFRAKEVSNPRPESEAMIGAAKDPHKLLTDLRTNIGTHTALGLPTPNSGLSVRLP
jgi:hypothetical protein